MKIQLSQVILLSGQSAAEIKVGIDTFGTLKFFVSRCKVTTLYPQAEISASSIQNFRPICTDTEVKRLQLIGCNLRKKWPVRPIKFHHLQ